MKNYLLIFILVFSNQLYSQIMLTNPKKDWSSFFNCIQKRCTIDVFCESGTYLGETAKKAALSFPIVHTMEVCYDYYIQAVKNTENFNNIIIHLGNSPDLLTSLLPKLKNQNNCTLFWLDGHFMSSMIGTEDKILAQYGYTPILEELKVIIANKLDKAIIMIDDIRLFGNYLENKRIEESGNKAYPLLIDVINLLNNNNYETIIYGDILFSYSKKLNFTFSLLVHSCFISRTYDGNNYPLKQVIEAEKIIAQANKKESQAIYELCYEFSMQWKTWKNKSPFYNLWYGLILQHNNFQQEACQQFIEVIRLGYNHKRIYWYLAQSMLALGNEKLCGSMIKEIKENV